MAQSKQPGAIPTNLSAEQFDEFVCPFLTGGRRGPKPKVTWHTMSNYVCWQVLAASYAMDHEDARSAGALGFMHRALVNTAMPYKDPKSRVFERRNGSFTLSILAGYAGGNPYGIYPRLLMSWVSTEVVRTKSPELELGESLAGFLRDVLNVSSSGRKHGTATRVAELMKRLFGSQIVAVDAGQPGRRPFKLRNMASRQRDGSR